MTRIAPSFAPGARPAWFVVCRASRGGLRGEEEGNSKHFDRVAYFPEEGSLDLSGPL